jgi:hypothetical protein
MEVVNTKKKVRFENEIVIFEIIFWKDPWTTVRKIVKKIPYTVPIQHKRV